MRRLVVDAMNVIGSRPDGWWRDRRAAERRLVAGLARLAEASGDEVTVVLDRPSAGGGTEPRARGVAVVHAARTGPDAADDAIVALVAADGRPGGLTVVTADAALAARVRALGASVAGPRSLLHELDAAGGRGGGEGSPLSSSDA